MEAYRLRRLIFHETVEFKFESFLPLIYSNVKERESKNKEKRHRSATVGNVSKPNHHRTHSEVKRFGVLSV